MPSTFESRCRSCDSDNLEVFLDLGNTPLADRLVSADALDAPEPRYPLKVAFCHDCSLVQILETVDPEVLFTDNYPYFSSISPFLLQHSRDNALDLIERRRLDQDSLVVELASNDGYLLKNYVESGITVLGIDPADGPAEAAERINVPTLCDFFTIDLARRLADQGKLADVVHGNNVLAHVADTNGFVEGIKILLKPTGIAVIEVPYLKSLIDHCEFDTIYHEHLCYFSVTALDKLFRRHGLYLNEIKHLGIHGGSLRLYVEPIEDVQASVSEALADEYALGIDTIRYFEDFSLRVQHVKQSLLALLRNLKAEGKRIGAYGAAAKGATLINFIGIDTGLIDFVVDRNVHKHGKRMPGQRIPILPAEQLIELMPDYVLLLAWNFADEIRSEQNAYEASGGQFIVPIPEPGIL